MFGNYPVIPIMNHSDDPLKLAHDRYDVFVNGDFVGQKVLLTETSDASDVNDFLHSRGFHDFRTHLEGDHFDIDVSDFDVADSMKEHLNVYLNTR